MVVFVGIGLLVQQVCFNKILRFKKLVS